MIIRVTVLWVIGLLTIVPYGIYHLLFTAGRDEYAFLITIVLFWVFGFWGVIGPVLSAIKVRQVFKALELASSREELERILKSPDSEEVAIELIASENRIPKFLGRRIYRMALRRFGGEQRPAGG